MKETKQLICVNCPKGCRITVTLQEGKAVEATGYSCENGKNHALQESECPMRILTTTVKISHGTLRVLPVMSEREIPLHSWKQAMEEVRNIQVEAPVSINQIIKENLCGTGVSLIASRSMDRI